MGKVVEHKSLEEKIQEKAGEVFEILKENGLFTRQFLSGTAWSVKEGGFRWWHDLFLRLNINDPSMFISLSDNTVIFMIPSASPLLEKIRNVGEQIAEKLNFEISIHRF